MRYDFAGISIFLARYYCMTIVVCGIQWKSISDSTAIVLKNYPWVLATAL